MSRLAYSFLFTLLTFASCSVKEGLDVPVIVADSFERAYPKATKVKWRMEGMDYEAVFTADGAMTSAVFDKDGQILGREIFVSKDQLPEVVRNSFQKDFPSAKIIRGTRVIDNFLKVKYEVITDKKEIVYSEKGELLRVNNN